VVLLTMRFVAREVVLPVQALGPHRLGPLVR